MKNLLIIILVCLFFSKVHSLETKIIHNIQNEIITNIDIKNEFKYLVALNSNLKELNKEKIFNISNESAIRERIKKIEILKNFKEIEINEKYLNLILKNMYTKLNLKSLNEFEFYLKNYDLTLSVVKKKLTIDALWNELILEKYASQVTINKEQIKNEISKNSNKQSKEYKLSEIIFEIKDKKEIKKNIKKLLKV